MVHAHLLLPLWEDVLQPEPHCCRLARCSSTLCRAGLFIFRICNGVLRCSSDLVCAVYMQQHKQRLAAAAAQHHQDGAAADAEDATAGTRSGLRLFGPKTRSHFVDGAE